MIKQLLLVTLFCLFICMNSMAQIPGIKGRVIELTSKEPLQFATIALYLENDSIAPQQVISTNLEGLFSFDEVNAGSYHVEVSFIGFLLYRTPVFDHVDQTNLGEILLQADPVLLDDVTIVGQRNTLVHDIDKKVYYVGQDIQSETGSASDILQNIPSITVDLDGGVTLRGTSNILFLVNGKPSALLRRSSATALQQIPAGNLERIEVITNPSAKYRPDGTGGIINLVMKDEKKEGFSGQISANAGNEERYGGSLNLNYGTENLNIYANYSIRHSGRSIFFTDQRTIRDSTGTQIISYYDEHGNSKNDALAHIINAGMEYDLNDQNNIQLSGTYFLQNGLHKGISEISYDDPLHQPATRITSNETNDEFEQEGEGTLAWEHIFKNNEDHVLTMEATYAAFDEEEDVTFYEIETFPVSESSIKKNLIQKSGQQSEIAVEYVLPVGEESELESGYVGDFTREDIRYTNDLLPGRYVLDQQVHALYGLWGQGLGNFSFKAGIRAEQALVGSHLKEPLDSLVQNNYLRFYPTLHLVYELAENKTLGLSYSKRISRPDADELNPNPEFSDPRTAEAGNPNLKPQQNHSIEASFHMAGDLLTFTPTLYYRYTYDAFTSIQTLIHDSILITTIENLDNRQSAGLEIILSGQPMKFLHFNLSSDVFYNQIDATALGYSEKKTALSGNLKLFVNFDVTKTTLLQLNAYYYSPRITPQGQRNQYYYLNAGAKQQLFKNRLVLSLTVSDLFYTYRRSSEIETPELSKLTESRRKGPVVKFGITWFFRPPDQNQGKDLKFEEETL